MRTRASVYLRFLAMFAVVGTLGLAATIYLLIEQRAALPGAHGLRVVVPFSEADGVIEGIGQPVNVAGVKVGSVRGVRLSGGRSLVTLELDRDQVPRVYADATAILEPITPLKDMQIALNPGAPPAPALPDGGILSPARTRPPVDLSELLSTLDGDTRAYLTSLIGSLDEGTRGRAADLRAALAAFAPTVAQAGRISHALAARRTELGRLVHNLGDIMRASSRDGQLADVVAAGDATANALATQEAPLRAALTQLPPTLAITRRTLADVQPFAARLTPTLTALTTAVDRLPGALRALGPFSATAEHELAQTVRPFVRAVNPLLADAAPAVRALDASAPGFTRAFKSLNYFFNELAYNPPGDDEGFLFWTAWAVHNLNSAFSSADAHGNIGRTTQISNCNGAQQMPQLKPLFGRLGICPA